MAAQMAADIVNAGGVVTEEDIMRCVVLYLFCVFCLIRCGDWFTEKIV